LGERASWLKADLSDTASDFFWIFGSMMDPNGVEKAFCEVRLYRVLGSSPIALYPYGMGRARDDRDAAQDLARDLADLAAQLAALKGEANAWLTDERYDALRHRLEDAHASVEAAAVEARRRVRVNEGRER
jgi:hypothetical protein